MKKICSRCKTEKDFLDFHNALNTKDGKQSQCKSCKKEMSKIYEKSRGKEKKKEYAKNEWQVKKNNPKYHEYRNKWIEKNKEKIAVKAKKYREQNKILLLASRSNQRAKKYGIEGKITMPQWKAVLEETNYMCISCEEVIADSIDHIVPLSLGGTNTYQNIQPMCTRCNLKKGTREIDFRTRDFVESVRKKCEES